MCHSSKAGTGKAISRVGAGLKMSGTGAADRLLVSGMFRETAPGARSGRMI